MQSNVLSMLTRMRQLALHPGLIPTNYLEDLRAMEDESNPSPVAAVTLEEKNRLKSLLAQAIEDFEECPICFCVLNSPRITSCAHIFCLAWCACQLVPLTLSILTFA
jgi:SWI/SNF-related matrix-associated actin-dependent regulator of chromatin subfamily A3